MLADLAVWFLRRKKKSVLIGFELTEGQMKPLKNEAFVYDCTLNNVSCFTYDGTPFELPSGEFFMGKEIIPRE